MSSTPRIGIHVALTDSLGGQLVYWHGLAGAKDAVILDELSGDAETTDVRIQVVDANGLDQGGLGDEPIAVVTLTGDEWRDLEGGDRLETFFDLLRQAGESIVADEPFYFVAQLDQATMQMTHRRLASKKQGQRRMCVVHSQ